MAAKSAASKMVRYGSENPRFVLVHSPEAFYGDETFENEELASYLRYAAFLSGPARDACVAT